MRVFNYVLLTLGLALIFELAGLSIAPSVLELVGIDVDAGAGGDYFNLKSSTFYLAIIIVLTSGLLGIVIGKLTSSGPENFIVLGLTGAAGTAGLLSFLSVALGITSYAFSNFPVGSSNDWIAWVTLTIMSLIGVGFVFSLVDWFRAHD
jgi:hypothetical protein